MGGGRPEAVLGPGENPPGGGLQDGRDLLRGELLPRPGVQERVLGARRKRQGWGHGEELSARNGQEFKLLQILVLKDV